MSSFFTALKKPASRRWTGCRPLKPKGPDLEARVFSDSVVLVFLSPKIFLDSRSRADLIFRRRKRC
jgi:hypothetical protein